MLLAQLLQGRVNLEEWSKETHLVSSILVNTGQELGPICLSTKLDPKDKMQQFTQKFFLAQAQLLGKWKEYSSKSEVKI